MNGFEEVVEVVADDGAELGHERVALVATDGEREAGGRAREVREQQAHGVETSVITKRHVGTVLTPTQIGDACMKALDTGKLETYVPYTDSVTTRLFGAFPWLIRRVEPAFAKIGERGRAKYLAR